MKKSLSALISLFLALGSVPAQAYQLIAWPVASASPMRSLLPGTPLPPPIRILPFPPRPTPRPPLPHPRPIPRPIPTPAPETTPMKLSGFRVTGDITDRVADLTYSITFHNPTPRRLEGVLLIPIPSRTVLSRLEMTVAGKKMKGELLEADKAGSIYEKIVRSMRDPALLELVGERLLRARVFPIEPHGDIDVTIAMTQILPKSGELYSLSIPLKSARLMGAVTGKVGVKIRLKSAKPLRTLYSPIPEVLIKREKKGALISYEADAARAEDVNIFYSLAEGPLSAGLLTFKEDGEDGFFLLSLTPRAQSPSQDAMPKDLVFIVDRSGSMDEGGKMEQARQALSFCLKRLGEKDRFGIVDFATGFNSFASVLRTASENEKKKALRYVSRLEAGGGTNIESALEEGLRLLTTTAGPRDSSRIPMVFFLTDGLPTVGETRIPNLLRLAAQKNDRTRARLFAFGVGSNVNTLFLDKLSSAHRGTRDYVAPGENIEHKVSSLYGKIAKPALSDVTLDWSGVETVQVYPKPTDLFHGSEMVLLGRFVKGGKGRLRVSGNSVGRKARFDFPLDFPKKSGGHDFLPRLWAHLKVSAELDAIRLSGKEDPEVVKSIVTIAKRYGIVTPYTSYLITEEGAATQTANREAMRRVRVMRANAVQSGFSGGVVRAKKAQAASKFLGAGSAMAYSAPSFGPPHGSDTYAYMPSFAGAMSSGLRQAEDEAVSELKAQGKRTVEKRTIAGKTFYMRSGTWVDAEAELAANSGRKIEIEFLSPEYFELLKRHPGLSKYLALGKNMTIAYKGRVYRIVPGR